MKHSGIMVMKLLRELTLMPATIARIRPGSQVKMATPRRVRSPGGEYGSCMLARKSRGGWSGGTAVLLGQWYLR